jgi:hypothetical protein
MVSGLYPGSVLVAVPTHERETLVRHCLATAAEVELPAQSEIMVFDDASANLDVAALMESEGLAPRLHVNPARLGATGTTVSIWRHFLGSGHQHLLILDSDMIANRTAVMDGLRLREKFEGLVTLYNSRLHPGVPIAEDTIVKWTVGNAGTLWTKALAELVLEAFGDAKVVNVDDAYSRLLRSRNIAIVSPTRSRLQHLGTVGMNNRYFGQLEHGLNFRPDSERQMLAIAAAYDDLMSRQDFYAPR